MQEAVRPSSGQASVSPLGERTRQVWLRGCTRGAPAGNRYREAGPRRRPCHGPCSPPRLAPTDAQEPRWASSLSSAPPAHFTGEETGVECHRSKCWSQNLSLGLSRPVPKTVLVSGLYTLSPRNASSSNKVQPSPTSRPEEPPLTLPFPNRDGPQRRTIEFLDPAAPRPACEQAVQGRKSDLVNKSSEWWRQGNLPGGSRPCQIASSILAIF